MRTRKAIDVSPLPRGPGLLAALLAILLAGCMTPVRKAEPPVPPPPSNQAIVPENKQQQALELEWQGAYLEALDYWEAARQTIDWQITSLKHELRRLSRKHSEQGVALYDQREAIKAFDQFLAALRLDPANPVAREYLLTRYQAAEQLRYQVEAGDTPSLIAEKVYGSARYAFLVTLLTSGGTDPREGATLELPRLDSYYSPPLQQYRRRILEARRLFKAGAYPQSLAVAETILREHPRDQEASYIVNRSLLASAAEMREQKQFQEAQKTLSRVDPAFKNTRPLIDEIIAEQQHFQQQQSATNSSNWFNRGMNRYRLGDLSGALQAFEQVDPDYPGLQQVLSDTRLALERKAEDHFNEGVRLFVEEDLAAAIDQWQLTLKLDPNHHRALDSIQQARALLKQLRDLR